jgi:hypothetical protein
MTYWEKYLIKMFIPVIFLVLFWMAGFLQNVLSQYLSSPKISFSATSLQMFSFLIIGLYTFISSAAVEPLNCVQQADGFYVLAKLRSEPCFAGTWNTYSPAIYLFFGIYCLLLPLVLAYILVHNKKNIGSDVFEHNFGSIVSPYKRRYYFWELLVVLRRSLFVISNNFLSFQGEDERYAVGVFFLFVFLFLDMIFSPYKSNNLNLLASS